MKYSPKELKFIVERIDKQLFELTEWERKFFTSIKPLINNGSTLSTKQAECLSKIWDKLENI